MSEGIVVTSKTQIIMVEPTSGSVSVISSGPPGPAGPPGLPGSGSGGFPIIENDGTYGYSIDIPSSGTMREMVRDNATGNYFTTRSYYSNGTDSTNLADAVESATGEFLQVLVASDSAHQSKLIWNSTDAPNQCNVNLGSGDPNGVVGSPKGSLFVDMTTPALWQSTAMFTWIEIGSGGGGGAASFPLSYNDGTNTYTISADDAADGHAGEMALVVTDGTASSHVDIGATYLDLRADGGGCTISSVGLLFLNSAGAGNDIQISSAHDIGHLAANRIDMYGLTVQFTGDHIWFTPNPSGASGKISFDGGSHEAHTPVNVTGSRGGNAALASLLTALTSVGMISNSTSA